MPLVVLDTNVIINLCHINRLADLRVMPAVEFLVTCEVNSEVKNQKMRARLDECIRDGVIRLHPDLVDLEVIDRRAQLRSLMQRGEAEALAVAESLGCHIACDERGAFRPEAVKNLGGDRVITTAGMMMQMIRHGAMTVEEADASKLTLERCGYVMSFVSFTELCRDISVVPRHKD